MTTQGYVVGATRKKVAFRTKTNTRLVFAPGAKRDVHDGFEVNGRALPRCGPKFPLAQGFHGIGIELRIQAANQFDAIYRAVSANHSVKHDLSLYMFVN
jgi:hypothetical protein